VTEIIESLTAERVAWIVREHVKPAGRSRKVISKLVGMHRNGAKRYSL
jgi:hypothetical protein